MNVRGFVPIGYASRLDTLKMRTPIEFSDRCYAKEWRYAGGAAARIPRAFMVIEKVPLILVPVA